MKLKQAIVTASLSLLSLPSQVFAAGDPFESSTKAAQDVTGKLSAFGLIVAVGAVVICGVAMMLSQKLREWGKQHLVGVVLGIILIALASQIPAFVQGLF